MLEAVKPGSASVSACRSNLAVEFNLVLPGHLSWFWKLPLSSL